MQVSGSYSAIGAITELGPTQRTRREPRRGGSGAGDTVSISEEAKAAFRNDFGKNGVDLAEDGAETAAKFRQALEDALNENEASEVSLMGRLRSAIATWKS